VVPCGFTAGPPVLPLTIQFYGKPFDESTLFRVSHAYESATDWHRRRPAVDSL
jgi:aspartyl-tRNA(Asn)/glutamyl-tRNA(Gln) amidotransferase subunit A